MSAPALQLARDYYLVNFKNVIDHTSRIYSDLLNNEELSLLKAFSSLSYQAQCLYVRLLMRKGVLFCCDKIHYPEIDDPTEAISVLQRANFVELIRFVETEAALPLYTKQQWQTLLAQQGIETKKYKALADVRAQVLLHWTDQLPAPSPILKLQFDHFWQRFVLLYFGNLYQNWQEFVITELGYRRYPKYKLSKSTRMFKNRQQLDEYLQLYEFEQNMPELKKLDIQALLDLIGHLDQQRFDTCVDKFNDLKFLIARELERRSPKLALSCYERIDNEPAFERCVRIWINRKEYHRAKQMCSAKLSGVNSPGLDLFLSTKLSLINNRLGLEDHAPRVEIPSTRMTCIRSDELSVEELACVLLRDKGDAFYVENSLIQCLFCLVYWELIYADITGAFTHPYQHRPHDFYQPDFIRPRAHLKYRCEQAFLSAGAEVEILERFSLYKDFRSVFGNWAWLKPELVRRTLLSIPKAQVLLIFNHLWSNLRSLRSGFPDLILFKPDNSYELIEVKGPGDTLQPNQKLWMQFFLAQNIPARVLHIDWSSSESH